MKKAIVLINHYEHEVSGVYSLDSQEDVAAFCKVSKDYSYKIKEVDLDLERLKNITKRKEG